MSGPTDTQLQLQQEQIDAYQQAEQLTKEQYANQQAIYGPMISQFQSIYANGPSQEGFSDEEKERLNAQAVEGTAHNYSSAAKAVGEQEAALGGGTNPLPTGAQLQQKEQVAESAAQEESSQESQIEAADYSQGYKEWEAAGQGLQTIAAGANPLGYEGAATGAGSAAGTTADQIAEEDNSWINATIGAVGSAAGMASGAAVGKYCWIAAEIYGGWLDPRTQKILQWLSGPFGDTLAGRIVCALYARYGEWTADMIRKHRIPRRPFQWLCDVALRKAEASLCQ